MFDLILVIICSFCFINLNQQEKKPTSKVARNINLILYTATIRQVLNYYLFFLFYFFVSSTFFILCLSFCFYSFFDSLLFFVFAMFSVCQLDEDKQPRCRITPFIIKRLLEVNNRLNKHILDSQITMIYSFYKVYIVANRA